MQAYPYNRKCCLEVGSSLDDFTFSPGEKEFINNGMSIARHLDAKLRAGADTLPTAYLIYLLPLRRLTHIVRVVGS